MTIDKAPDCRSCRWCREGTLRISGATRVVDLCDSPDTDSALPSIARNQNCGPAGRYYEPRDEK